jgi:hypothetical protein
MPIQGTSTRRRITGALLGAVVVAFAACHEQVSHSYGPAADAAAMTAIASVWSQPGGLSVALCEDVARSQASAPDGCLADHVVLGGGVEQSVSHPGGCGMGGCPFENVAYVRGMAEGAGLPGAVAVGGMVSLQGGHADDPYAFPYTMRLTCVDTAAPCTVAGTLSADGHLETTLVLGTPGPGVPETHHALDRTGPAACP